jgi:long-chain acyl-CoA synthetase
LFHTPNLGYIDADGDVFIVDRKKDMILRGGYCVFPREAQEVLVTHPAIREAAVIGVADDRLGEDLKAVVCKTAPDSVNSAEYL